MLISWSVQECSYAELVFTVPLQHNLGDFEVAIISLVDAKHRWLVNVGKKKKVCVLTLKEKIFTEYLAAKQQNLLL